jgi:hypothetical protein
VGFILACTGHRYRAVAGSNPALPTKSYPFLCVNVVAGGGVGVYKVCLSFSCFFACRCALTARVFPYVLFSFSRFFLKYTSKAAARAAAEAMKATATNAVGKDPVSWCDEDCDGLGDESGEPPAHSGNSMLTLSMSKGVVRGYWSVKFS